MGRRLGKRQIDLMKRLDADEFLFKPTRDGRPWKSIQRLVQLGLAHAAIERRRFWCPDTGDWRDDPQGNRYVAELTLDGIMALRRAKEGGDG